MIPKTNEIRIETSTICNAKCVFCPTSSRLREIMDLDIFKFYLDKSLNELGDQITQISFSGFGEIFTDKGIIDKVRYASSKKLDIHILSNGSLITKNDIDNLYDISIKDIRFSLHTTNSDNYSKIMNFKFKFDDIMKIVNYAIEYKSENTEVIITANIVEENKDDVDNLIKEFGDRCVLEIWYPHNWIYGKKYRSGKISKKTCGRPFNGPIQIQINGDVIPCCFDYDNKLVLGNLKTNTLTEIFSDYIFINLYNHHKNGTCSRSDLLCKNCDQLLDNSNIVIYNNRIDKHERMKYTSTNLNKLEE